MDVSDLRLDGGERLLWSGTPRQGFVLTAQDAFTIPFSVMWCGFIFIALRNGIENDTPLFSVLWLGMFALIGVYLLVGRFAFDAWRRSNTFYALTSQRVVILSRSGEQSLPLSTLNDLTVKVRGDGRGTITFGRGADTFGTLSPGFRRRGSPWTGSSSWQPALEGIPDASTVAAQIRSAQQDTKRS
jgi:hypothetical protein